MISSARFAVACSLLTGSSMALVGTGCTAATQSQASGSLAFARVDGTSAEQRGQTMTEAAPACAVTGDAEVTVSRAFMRSGIDAVAAADATSRSVSLGGRVVRGARAVEGGGVIGTVDGDLVMAPSPSDAPKTLWHLRSNGAVDGLHGVALAGGTVVTFRQAGVIWLGAVGADGAPTTALEKVPSAGGHVGAPTLAASGAHALVAWAERANDGALWSVQSSTWTPGDAPRAPEAFKAPPGGLGGSTMSPSLAPLGGDRFLLVWTEGNVYTHELRAQTLSLSEGPMGAPMTVSAEGVNVLGQGQATMTSDGRGAIVFLASTGEGFQAVSTPITCAVDGKASAEERVARSGR